MAQTQRSMRLNRRERLERERERERERESILCWRQDGGLATVDLE